MEEMIVLMRDIENHLPVIEAKEKGGTVYLTDDDFLSDDIVFVDMVDKWETLADEFLIDADGQLNHDNIEKLKKVGYRVGPGERDSFGWLSGKVSKENLVYIFG
tara:strand:- start:16663 stop:16974 length:312 start_codon:yes stop_codon:yes gene_type:complete